MREWHNATFFDTVMQEEEEEEEEEKEEEEEMIIGFSNMIYYVSCIEKRDAKLYTMFTFMFH
jgi:hypothetical protein